VRPGPHHHHHHGLVLGDQLGHDPGEQRGERDRAGVIVVVVADLPGVQ
jgi:hypothetical protein